MRLVLHASDLLLMTSRTEGMPGVVIEAGLCGVPTVAPAVGAMENLIVHGTTGIITQSTSPEVVAEAIQTLLPIAGEAGVAAREHLSAGYSWTSVAPRWAASLASVPTTSASRTIG